MAIKLVEWPVFDKIVLFLIAFNCIVLTVDDPICKCANIDECSQWDYYSQSLYSWDCSNWPTTKALLDASELIFTSLFTAEVRTEHSITLASPFDPELRRWSSKFSPGDSSCTGTPTSEIRGTGSTSVRSRPRPRRLELRP